MELWAREMLSTKEARIRADAIALNIETTDSTLRKLRERYQGKSQQVEIRCKPIDTEKWLADFRKDITIEIFNESGQKVLAYHVFRCWVSEYQALPEHDANANAVAIQTIKLENEGWQRDTSVIEPAEPTLAS